MPKNHYALGVDGGASRLKWVIRDPEGQIRSGQATGANLQLVGWDAYIEQLSQLIDFAILRTGAAEDEILTVGVGQAGMERPNEVDRLYRWLLRRFPHLQGCWVGNDSLAALRQGAGRLQGIVLIAGSGSIAYGVTAKGTRDRVGGWGGRIGDEGSASWIGRAGLSLVTRMADGRVPKGPLMEKLLEQIHLRTPEELIPWTSVRGAVEWKADVAALAPVVIQLAREDDPVSTRITKDAIEHLIRHVETLIVKLDRMVSAEEAQLHRQVVCAGGLFEHVPGFFEMFEERLNQGDKGLKAVRLTAPAALGALELGTENPAKEMI